MCRLPGIVAGALRHRFELGEIDVEAVDFLKLRCSLTLDDRDLLLFRQSGVRVGLRHSLFLLGQDRAKDPVRTVPSACLAFAISLAAPFVGSSHSAISPAASSASAGAAVLRVVK